MSREITAASEVRLDVDENTDHWWDVVPEGAIFHRLGGEPSRVCFDEWRMGGEIAHYVVDLWTDLAYGPTFEPLALVDRLKAEGVGP